MIFGLMTYHHMMITMMLCEDDMRRDSVDAVAMMILNKW